MVLLGAWEKEVGADSDPEPGSGCFTLEMWSEFDVPNDRNESFLLSSPSSSLVVRLHVWITDETQVERSPTLAFSAHEWNGMESCRCYLRQG